MNKWIQGTRSCTSILTEEKGVGCAHWSYCLSDHYMKERLLIQSQSKWRGWTRSPPRYPSLMCSPPVHTRLLSRWGTWCWTLCGPTPAFLIYGIQQFDVWRGKTSLQYKCRHSEVSQNMDALNTHREGHARIRIIN